jgi:beta-lactamase regulating signal transducer with metallopeptidase domain
MEDEMAAMLEFLDPLARMLLQGMVNSLWQATLIVGLVFLLFRALNRPSAATRHAIWLISLAAISILPFVPMLSHQADPIRSAETAVETAPLATSAASEKGLPTNPSIPQRSAAQNADHARLSIVIPLKPSVSPQIKLYTPNAPVQIGIRRQAVMIVGAINRWVANALDGRAALLLFLVWLAGSLFMLARIGRSYLFLTRIGRSLDAHPESDRQVARLGAICNIRRKARTYSSSLVSMPMTTGWLHPLIIIPRGLGKILTPAEFESVLAHEVAHINRWDYVTNLWLRVVEALLFFNPAVWVIGSQLEVERELACDDWAVKLTGEPRRYANCLTKLMEMLVESRNPLALATGIILEKNVISRRIEMLLNHHRNGATSASKPALAYALCLAALFVASLSLLSPVIAVPLASSLSGEQMASLHLNQSQQKTAVTVPAKPATTAQTEATRAAQSSPQIATTMPSAAKAPVVLVLDDDEEIPTLPDDDETPVAASTAAGTLVGWNGQHIAPQALATWAVAQTPAAAPAPVFSDEQRPVLTRRPEPSPAPALPMDRRQDKAPRAVRVGDTSTPPAISEAELLGILVDVVKKDADPGVRQEALQGIYRLKSQASADALLSLYDAIPDVKTKAEVLGYLIRRDGDNSKAVAKLLSIARTEKDETLRNKAIGQLGLVKGDEGANNLIQIYDSTQDAKTKQRLIRSLALNKSRKAIDKLIQIAKNDSDPTVRQSAIRGLYSIDQRHYMELFDGVKPGVSFNDFEHAKEFAKEFAKEGKFKGDYEKLFKDKEHFKFDFDMDDWQRNVQDWQFKLEELNIDAPNIKIAPMPKLHKAPTVIVK